MILTAGLSRRAVSPRSDIREERPEASEIRAPSNEALSDDKPVRPADALTGTPKSCDLAETPGHIPQPEHWDPAAVPGAIDSSCEGLRRIKAPVKHSVSGPGRQANGPLQAKPVPGPRGVLRGGRAPVAGSIERTAGRPALSWNGGSVLVSLGCGDRERDRRPPSAGIGRGDLAERIGLDYRHPASPPMVDPGPRTVSRGRPLSGLLPCAGARIG